MLTAQHKNLTLITICFSGKNYGQGDISAALKLIEGIVKSNQYEAVHVNITWVICLRYFQNDLPFYESFVQKALSLGIRVVVSDLWGVKIDESSLSQADLLVYFPAVRYLGIISTRVNKYKDKLLSIGEYNVDHHKKNVCTGLGKGRLGIFIEENLAPPLLLILNQASDTDKELLQQLALIDISTQTVTPEKIASYKQEHILFFGYFAFNLNNSSNTEVVNPIKFCEIALCIAALKAVKNVDIIVRLGDSFGDLPINYFASICSSIEIITSTHAFTIKNPTGNNNLPKARIFDFFPMSNNVFKFLMSILAEKYFMGLTGDQSLTEGICCNAVIFLQIMLWKQNLANALNQVCHQTLPRDAKLLIFNDYVINKEEADLSATKIAQFIVMNETQLLIEMRHVHQEIQAKFNLLENLVPRLRRAMIYPHQIEQIFVDYQKVNAGAFNPLIYNKIPNPSLSAANTLDLLSKFSVSNQEQLDPVEDIRDSKQDFLIMFNKIYLNKINDNYITKNLPIYSMLYPRNFKMHSLTFGSYR
jgi:hypothetical protein